MATIIIIIIISLSLHLLIMMMTSDNTPTSAVPVQLINCKDCLWNYYYYTTTTVTFSFCVNQPLFRSHSWVKHPKENMIQGLLSNQQITAINNAFLSVSWRQSSSSSIRQKHKNVFLCSGSTHVEKWKYWSWFEVQNQISPEIKRICPWLYLTQDQVSWKSVHG